MEEKTKLILNEITNELSVRFKALLDICESPIEEYFLINICNHFFKESLLGVQFDFMTRWIDFPHSKEKFNYQENGCDVFGFIYGIKITNGDNITLEIIPQYKVKRFRLDFAILINTPNKLIKFCVECDGFEHHKSKIQQKEDNTRTRELTKDGWITVRYTGSELFNWDKNDAFGFELILLGFLSK